LPASRIGGFEPPSHPESKPMATSRLGGRRVAILVEDLFEQAELEQPLNALKAAGATVHVVSRRGPQVTGMQHHDPGDRFDVDVKLDDARPEDYDGLVIPGGVINADSLRLVEGAKRFAQAFDRLGKPIAVICHGGWLLVSAGLVRGRTMTSWPTLQDDIRNAGGHWVDREVASDRNWTSSRKPDDLPAFNRQFIAVLERVPARKDAVRP
jgi:protease I